MPSDSDVNLLARALYSEFGRFDSWPDMQAGGWTILNRIRPSGSWPAYRFELGRTLREVLERRGPDGVPQYSILQDGGSPEWRESANPDRLVGPNRKAWELALQTAEQLLGGQLPDMTAGATSFHNESMGRPPKVRGWFGEFLGDTIEQSPYRSPNDANYFYRVIADPRRRIPQKPRTRPAR